MSEKEGTQEKTTKETDQENQILFCDLEFDLQTQNQNEKNKQHQLEQANERKRERIKQIHMT